MSGTGDLAQESMPLCGLLGVSTVQADPARVVLRLEWRPELCTVAGSMHGGAIMSLADSSGAIAAFLNLPDGASGTSTIQSSTSLTGAVRAGVLEATSTAVHVGRTTIVVSTEVRNDGRLVASTMQTQAVLGPTTV